MLLSLHFQGGIVLKGGGTVGVYCVVSKHTSGNTSDGDCDVQLRGIMMKNAWKGWLPEDMPNFCFYQNHPCSANQTSTVDEHHSDEQTLISVLQHAEFQLNTLRSTHQGEWDTKQADHLIYNFHLADRLAFDGVNRYSHPSRPLHFTPKSSRKLFLLIDPFLTLCVVARPHKVLQSEALFNKLKEMSCAYLVCYFSTRVSETDRRHVSGGQSRGLEGEVALLAGARTRAPYYRYAQPPLRFRGPGRIATKCDRASERSSCLPTTYIETKNLWQRIRPQRDTYCRT